MAVNTRRVLVHLQRNKASIPQSIQFQQSLLSILGHSGDSGDVYCCKKDDSVILSSSAIDGFDGPYKITKPSFCPIHNMTSDHISQLPEATVTRGVDCGAAAVMETCDGYVLLIRRADHLRTFPRVWVPPGGHIEINETIAEAALRELKEETGLEIKQDMCVNQQCSVYCMWESVFPPMLSSGLPRRHHAVFYIYAPLAAPYTKAYLQQRLKLDQSETGASCWLHKDMIQAIVDTSSYSDTPTSGATPETLIQAYNLKEMFELTEVTASGATRNREHQTSVLLTTYTEERKDAERVSTGTKYALAQYLKLLDIAHK